jgi:hypothetical protein
VRILKRTACRKGTSAGVSHRSASGAAATSIDAVAHEVAASVLRAIRARLVRQGMPLAEVAELPGDMS